MHNWSASEWASEPGILFLWCWILRCCLNVKQVRQRAQRATLLASSLCYWPWMLNSWIRSIKTLGVLTRPTRSVRTITIHTECPRRNGQNFGRVFLMLKYTDVTQNTYVQSWTVTEIKAREKCGLLAVPCTVPGSRDVIPIRCALSVLVYGRLKRVPRCDCTCTVLGNPKDNYDMSASVL